MSRRRRSIGVAPPKSRTIGRSASAVPFGADKPARPAFNPDTVSRHRAPSNVTSTTFSVFRLCARIGSRDQTEHAHSTMTATTVSLRIRTPSVALSVSRDMIAQRMKSSERTPGTTGAPLLFTPGPLTTSAAVKAAMGTDVGSRDGDFLALVARVRARLLEIAGTSREAGYTAIPMQGSGTFAVEAMIGTLVPPGGRLLVLENGAYGRRIAEIARVLGIHCVTVSIPPALPFTATDALAALLRHDSLTHVALVHCETTTGVVNPLAEIATVVADSGCRFLVDAMSSFGAMPVTVGDHSIDALAASSNKCL